MEICKIHYKISKPVTSYKEIKEEAEKMRRFIVLGDFKGYYNKAFSLSHCQVSETPYAFFVTAPECIKEKMFADDVIINPQIVEANKTKEIKSNAGKMGEKNVISIPNIIEYQEPCMSFPFRKPKAVKRYDVIRVRYQIPGFFRFKTIEATLSGIASEIFQHEYDHCQGKNIYFESENPVKWWELLGTPKSKGGTSLDPPEELGLKRAKENEKE
jgi:peptide deformylase